MNAPLERVEIHDIGGTQWERLVRTPLLTKLIVLDITINVFAYGAIQSVPKHLTDEFTVGSLALVLVLNAALVAWALRPLAVLEATTRRVSEGEYTVRSAMPPLADPNLKRIADTLNALLDRFADERARVRLLAARVVDTGDQERSRIARELHDGTAQSLSALDMLLTSTLALDPTPVVRENLAIMQEIINEALHEVRSLAQAVHPGMVEDLGLEQALKALVRRASAQSSSVVSVTGTLDCELSAAANSTLYRIAQEAVHNALKHAKASEIRLELTQTPTEVRMVVADDGVGFDRTALDPTRQGMGLFVMEERCVLVRATLRISSGLGQGTRVIATLPLDGAP